MKLDNPRIANYDEHQQDLKNPAKERMPLSTPHSPLKKWIRDPVIHFFVLGLVVFGLHAMLEKKPVAAEDPSLIEVTSADIEWFRTMWTKRMGREPTVQELRGQVNQLIREQVLSREAVSLGLDKGDTVVRRRLSQKMDFLFQDLSKLPEPTDDELRTYFRKNRSGYEIPGRMTFTHVFFNADKRGDMGATEAVGRLIKRWDAVHEGEWELKSAGDAFLLRSHYADRTVPEIRRDFGPRFAEAVWAQKAGVWQGPVVSGFGLHAVYVHERISPRYPDFDELKERLRADWFVEQQREVTRKTYEQVRKRYRVLLEGMPYDMDIQS